MNDGVTRRQPSPEEQAQVIAALRSLASPSAGPRDAVVAIAESLRQMQADLQDAFRQAAPVVEQLDRMKRGTTAWKESQARATELLAPHGWVLPFRTAMSGSASRIVEIAEREGIAAAESVLMRELTPSTCRRMIVDCAVHEAFQDWEDHLTAAMEAHEAGQYLLCIPVWLIVFDGVAHARLNAVLRD